MINAKLVEYKDLEQFSLDAEQANHDPVELPEIPKSEQLVYTQKPDPDIDLAGDELKAYYTSLNLNVECGRAIDQAIIASNYDQYRYDLKTAVRGVIDEFGADRVAWVVASNVNNSNHDGRFSTANKAWAKDFDTPKPDFYLKTHLAVLNGFVDNFRKAEKEKPSLMATLNAGEKKSKSQTGVDTPDKSTQKKKDGMEV